MVDGNLVAASQQRQRRPSARGALLLGSVSLLVCIVSFVGQTTVTRQIQQSYVHPYFILWVAHSSWTLMLPLHAAYERLKRNPRSLGALRTEVLVASAMLIVQLRRRRRQTSSSPPPPPPGEYQPVDTAEADGSARRRSGAIELASDVAHMRSVPKADSEAGSVDRPAGNGSDNDIDDSNGADGVTRDGCSDEAWALAQARPWWVLGRMAALAAALVLLLNA
ncbi:hypothetical protein H4R19_004877, partial [Coemansia spiralis]